MAKLRKIEASTLVEALVAMVIITLIFTIVLTILSNISGKNDPQLKLKAYTEAQKVMSSGIGRETIHEEQWQKEGLMIERMVLPYLEYDSLCMLEVRVSGNTGKVLVDMKSLIRITE